MAAIRKKDGCCGASEELGTSGSGVRLKIFELVFLLKVKWLSLYVFDSVWGGCLCRLIGC